MPQRAGGFFHPVSLAASSTRFRKRLAKTTKLYFYGLGLAARLTGIKSAAQMRTHPLRGAAFENWAVTEFLKRRWNEGKQSNLFLLAQPRRSGDRSGPGAGAVAGACRDPVGRDGRSGLAAGATPLVRVGRGLRRSAGDRVWWQPGTATHGCRRRSPAAVVAVTSLDGATVSMGRSRALDGAVSYTDWLRHQ